MLGTVNVENYTEEKIYSLPQKISLQKPTLTTQLSLLKTHFKRTQRKISNTEE